MMQLLWSILLAGAAEGEDLGMVRRQDHNHAHRQCHGRKAALACGHSTHFWPPTSVSPHPIPVARRKHLALCLAAWDTRRWEPQGLVEALGPLFLPPQPWDLPSASALWLSPSCKPFPVAVWFLSCLSELHPYLLAIFYLLFKVCQLWNFYSKHSCFCSLPRQVKLQKQAQTHQSQCWGSCILLRKLMQW